MFLAPAVDAIVQHLDPPFRTEAPILPAFMNVDNWEHSPESFSRIAFNERESAYPRFSGYMPQPIPQPQYLKQCIFQR